MGSVEGQPDNARVPRRRSTGNRNRLTAALLAAGVIVSAVGCGASASGPSAAAPASSSGSPTLSGPASSSGSSSAQAVQASQDALAAYRAAYADWVEAAKTSNYQDLALEHHMSGQALSYVSGALRVDQVQGSVSKGAPVLHPTIGQLLPPNDPTEVVINDVIDTRSWLQYTTDGHLYNDTPGGCRQTQALLVKKDDVWKVDQFAINKVGTGSC